MKLFQILAVASLMVFAAFVTSQADTDGYCRVLAASGGGDRIFFQFGAFSAFNALYPNPQDVQYDVVTGISAGSLLSSILSRYPIGKEEEAISGLHKALFAIQSRSDIIKEWPGGTWDGIFNQSGLFDSSPLFDRINEWILTKPPTDRRLLIGAVSLEDGRLDIYHEDSYNLNLGILGSCSVPFVFPSVPIKLKNGTNRHYVDGGVKSGILIEPGIESCLERGFKPDKIIVDIILCYPVDLQVTPLGDLNTIDATIRSLSVSSFISSVAKTMAAYQKYPDIIWRNIIQPDPVIGPLPSMGLNFEPAEMQYMYQRGMNDTRIQFLKYPNGNALEVFKTLAELVKDNHIQP